MRYYSSAYSSISGTSLKLNRVRSKGLSLPFWNVKNPFRSVTGINLNEVAGQKGNESIWKNLSDKLKRVCVDVQCCTTFSHPCAHGFMDTPTKKAH